MISSLYFKVPKKIRIFIFFLLIILIFYFVGSFIFMKTETIPSDFLSARQEASLIAQGIVGMSNESAKKIDEIADLSNKEDYTEALNLVVSEMERNREIRQKAIELSSSLESMTRSSSKIYPDSSARIALEAVSVETTLISRLVDYNDYLNQLLEILQMKILGKGDSHQKIIDLISKINDEANAINDLNQRFNDLMKVFDLNK